MRFSVDEYSLKEISDSQIMELEMKLVSEGDNRHNLPITRDAVINSAETIIGKPVLYKFNSATQDAMGHEEDEIACGVCALTKDDYFFKEIDGKLWLFMKAYIWKMYFEDIANVFTRDKEKAISMEMFIVDSEIDEDDETLETITAFCFAGVTVLGKMYNPAIEDAEAKVIKYNKETFSSLVDKTRKIIFSNINTDTKNQEVKEAGKLDKFNKTEFAKKYSLTANEMFEMFQAKLNECTYKNGDFECKKYYVRDFCNKYVYARDWETEKTIAIPFSMTKKDISLDYENIKACRMTYIVDEEEDDDSDMVQMYADRIAKEKSEKEVKKVKAEFEKTEKEFEKNKAELEKSKIEFETKIKDLEAEKTTLNESIITFTTEKEELNNKIGEFQEKITSLESEKEELAKFKADIEKQDRENKINYAIQTVKESLTEDQLKEWQDKVDEFETIESYTNAIQAFAYTQVKEIPNNENIRIHIPNNENSENKGLWD